MFLLFFYQVLLVNYSIVSIDNSNMQHQHKTIHSTIPSGSTSKYPLKPIQMFQLENDLVLHRIPI